MADDIYYALRRTLLPTTLVSSGLAAEWRFDEGTGTQVTDYSGNANHGTLGGGGVQPTWAADGLSFNFDLVTIPPALWAMNYTYQFVCDWSAPTGTAQSIIAGNNAPRFYLHPTTAHIACWVNPSIVTRMAVRPTSGVHMVTMTTESYPSIFFDETEATYAADTGSAMSASASSLMLGFVPGNGEGYFGKIYYGLVYNRVLTDAEIVRNTGFLRTLLADRGVVIP